MPKAQKKNFIFKIYAFCNLNVKYIYGSIVKMKPEMRGQFTPTHWKLVKASDTKRPSHYL